MDTDLLTVARTLAERGWLPGIEDDGLDEFVVRMGPMLIRDATEADLHLAAHNEIVRRGWAYMPTPDYGTEGTTSMYGDESNELEIHEPGTTTLALLRCLLRAIEASEKSKERSDCERSEQETPNGS